MSKDPFVQFPADFLWGAATSSFQIEGSPLADGACESDWYRWTKSTGRIANGDNADVACDHYHRFKQDIALMKSLGLKAYRFSISWPRVMPERGRINEKALDFYRALIDEIIKAGITPFGTLYHWEVPHWAKGGWENRETALAFGEYAKVVLEKLGSKVPFWATQNEPSVVAACGYLWGVFPPGKKDKKVFGQVVHHLNLAHGLAAQAFRQLNLGSQLGWVLALGTLESASERNEDISQTEKMDIIHNRAFLDPVAGRGYPSRLFEFTDTPQGPIEEDLKVIQQPLDFLGMNHYVRGIGRYHKGINILDNDGKLAPGTPLNDMGWEVRPRSLSDALLHFSKAYSFPKIYVTESGMAMRRSKRSPEEVVEDDARVHYMGTYLAEANKALKAGVPLKGYFAWSFLDNFEWAEGYDPMFGMVAVDPETQARTLKKSALWYKQVIAEGGFKPDELPQNPAYQRSPELMEDAR